MATAEPVPQPGNVPNYGIADAVEYILESAMAWRRRELQNSELARAELQNLRFGLDKLNALIRIKELEASK